MNCECEPDMHTQMVYHDREWGVYIRYCGHCDSAEVVTP
jgi:hypothetical protein